MLSRVVQRSLYDAFHGELAHAKATAAAASSTAPPAASAARKSRSGRMNRTPGPVGPAPPVMSLLDEVRRGRRERPELEGGEEHVGVSGPREAPDLGPTPAPGHGPEQVERRPLQLGGRFAVTDDPGTVIG